MLGQKKKKKPQQNPKIEIIQSCSLMRLELIQKSIIKIKLEKSQRHDSNKFLNNLRYKQEKKAEIRKYFEMNKYE